LFSNTSYLSLHWNIDLKTLKQSCWRRGPPAAIVMTGYGPPVGAHSNTAAQLYHTTTKCHVTTTWSNALYYYYHYHRHYCRSGFVLQHVPMHCDDITHSRPVDRRVIIIARRDVWPPSRAPAGGDPSADLFSYRPAADNRRYCARRHCHTLKKYYPIIIMHALFDSVVLLYHTRRHKTMWYARRR